LIRPFLETVESSPKDEARTPILQLIKKQLQRILVLWILQQLLFCLSELLNIHFDLFSSSASEGRHE
jgi:hypothetical protein